MENGRDNSMTTSVTELRTSARAIWAVINRGDTVVISYRGKPYAKIVPLDLEADAAQSDSLFGVWKDNQKVDSVEDFIRDVRRVRNAR